MNHAGFVTAADFASDCPVPLDLVARLMRTKADAVPGLLDGIAETTRARLAIWLYGRSHTHEIGVRVAATCEGEILRRTAGHIGDALHDLSRRPYEAPSHGTVRPAGRRISLGGSRVAA